MLNPEPIAKEFWETGIYFPIPVLDKSDLDYFREAFYTHLEHLGNRVTPTNLGQLHLHFPWAYELVTHPRVVEIIKAVLGPDILVHNSTIFYKEPNGQKYISWHQDSYYQKLNSFEYISAWVALEACCQENGCLRLIPNTHHSIVPHSENRHKNNMLGRGLTVDIPIVEKEAVDVELHAGEMSLHHVNTIHGSNPNRSNRRRVGMAIRYISPQVTQQVYHHQVIVAAGKYNGCHFKVVDRPTQKSFEESFKEQTITNDLFKKGFEGTYFKLKEGG